MEQTASARRAGRAVWSVASMLREAAVNGRTSLDRHGGSERRDAVLVEALDGRPICLPDRECAQIERGALVGEALVGLIQLGGRDPPPHVVADDAGDGLPGERRVALVAVAARREASGRRRQGAATGAEHADVAD